MKEGLKIMNFKKLRIRSFQRDSLLLSLISESRSKEREIFAFAIFESSGHGGREHRLGDKFDRIAHLSSGYRPPNPYHGGGEGWA